VDLVNAISEKLVNYPEVEILFEPGRSIVANAGLLVTKVEYTKHQDDNHFAIVDAGMNDLIRPALYNAWMNIIPVNKHEVNETPYSYNIVGPICESSDVLGKNRQLAIKQDDLLAICGAGAYGFSMASNYNSHPRPAEVMINSLEHRLIRKRETFQSLWDGETI
uniref:diaminopimelate decarboxylase family protein n=1 Tax=Frischella perrara TaxID=1267021 RepID=UPI003C6D5571